MRYLLFILLIGCAHGIDNNKKKKIQRTSVKGKFKYNYVDQSGNYIQEREVLRRKNKLILRNKIYSSRSSKPLEKLVVVSQVGRIKKGNNSSSIAILPEVSQFKVWFDKKEYFSQIKLDKKNQLLRVISSSPEKKWNFQKTFKIPKTRYICFFSQIPECLILQGLLIESVNKKIELYIIWDNFPYQNEQYEGVLSTPLVKAELYISKHDKNEIRYAVDIGNQVIFYHFDDKLRFIKLNWIPQGISTNIVTKGLL